MYKIVSFRYESVIQKNNFAPPPPTNHKSVPMALCKSYHTSQKSVSCSVPTQYAIRSATAAYSNTFPNKYCW